MNSDILKGKWNQIKGDVKKSFGKLTDNDMMVIEGDNTKAVGLLQERYGYTHEEAEKHWDEFTRLHTTQDVKNEARNAVNKAKSKM